MSEIVMSEIGKSKQDSRATPGAPKRKRIRPSKPCEHGTANTFFCVQCKELGRISYLCLHNRRRTRCKDCKGNDLCEHNKMKQSCKYCATRCEHGKIVCRCPHCKFTKTTEQNKTTHKASKVLSFTEQEPEPEPEPQAAAGAACPQPASKDDSEAGSESESSEIESEIESEYAGEEPDELPDFHGFPGIQTDP